MLAFELAAFLPIDIAVAKLRVNGKIISVDMCDETHRLIVEYDGGYWHRGKEERDSKKTAALEAEGWTVIRVRVSPLQPVGTHTVFATHSTEAHVTAAEVLAIVHELGIPAGNLQRYIDDAVPVARQAAEAYIEDMLASSR